MDSLTYGLFRRAASLSSPAKLAVMLLADAFFLPACMVLAVALRLGSVEAAFETALGLQLAVALLGIPAFAFAGLYRAIVRYIDLRVLTASGAALAGVVLVLYAVARAMGLDSLPRSSLLIFWFVAFTYAVTSRFVSRWLLLRGQRQHKRARVRTAIYGAGEAGVHLAQAMSLSQDYQAVCFIDDRRDLRGKTLAGLKVHDGSKLDDLSMRLAIEQIVVAIPSANASHKKRLISRMESLGLPVKILPGLRAMVDGEARVSDLREVDVADLLGRDPVAPVQSLFARNIAGQSVLVTGAGGSIGSELCRQILSLKPKRLILLDHSEFALYTISQELGPSAGETHLRQCLGSVLDEGLVERLMRDESVDTVYHAAAYKHVPIVENNVRLGLLNNVFGSLAVSRAAVRAGVGTCVLISTDKAVRPTNVMGVSKRIAELIFQAAAQRQAQSPSARPTVFSMVRFGNVLGSSGSVVPLFRAQIQAGGPVTVTHPEIIRYFMLIPEAAQLVIQAGAMAQGGEVFVLDMGEPVRIIDLARSMIRLSGLTERTPERPDGDIEIQATGLRPGEKLFEELLIGDNVIASGHPRIRCARERHIDPALLDKMLQSLRQACDADDAEAMMRLAQNFVPEYRPADEVNAAVMASRAMS